MFQIFVMEKMAKLHLFNSKEDALDLYCPKKLYDSYKIYFNGNISNTNIGLDVLIKGKICAHIWMWYGGYFGT